MKNIYFQNEAVKLINDDCFHALKKWVKKY